MFQATQQVSFNLFFSLLKNNRIQLMDHFNWISLKEAIEFYLWFDLKRILYVNLLIFDALFLDRYINW